MATITINKKLVRYFFICLGISFMFVFIANHTGKFSYIADTTGLPTHDSQGRLLANMYVPMTAKVLSVIYTSAFGTEIRVSGSNYQVVDVHYIDGKFYDYSNTFRFYLQATFKEIGYVFLIGLLLFSLYILFTRVTFKVA